MSSIARSELPTGPLRTHCGMWRVYGRAHSTGSVHKDSWGEARGVSILLGVHAGGFRRAKDVSQRCVMWSVSDGGLDTANRKTRLPGEVIRRLTSNSF